jgi:hypothetical protein
MQEGCKTCNCCYIRKFFSKQENTVLVLFWERGCIASPCLCPTPREYQILIEIIELGKERTEGEPVGSMPWRAPPKLGANMFRHPAQQIRDMCPEKMDFMALPVSNHRYSSSRYPLLIQYKNKPHDDPNWCGHEQVYPVF